MIGQKVTFRITRSNILDSTVQAAVLGRQFPWVVAVLPFNSSNDDKTHSRSKLRYVSMVEDIIRWSKYESIPCERHCSGNVIP